MSHIADFPAVAHRERDWPESHRKLSQATNFLLGETDQQQDNLELINTILKAMEAINSEAAMIIGATTFDTIPPKLINYTDFYVPTPPVLSDHEQQIAYDLAAGTITVGYDGLYELMGYAVQTAGTNNEAYAMAIMLNGATEFALGSGVWTQQAGGLVYSAGTVAPLTAGDVLTLEYLGLNEPVVGESSLKVTLESLT